MEASLGNMGERMLEPAGFGLFSYLPEGEWNKEWSLARPRAAAGRTAHLRRFMDLFQAEGMFCKPLGSAGSEEG